MLSKFSIGGVTAFAVCMLAANQSQQSVSLLKIKSEEQARKLIQTLAKEENAKFNEFLELEASCNKHL